MTKYASRDHGRKTLLCIPLTLNSRHGHNFGVFAIKTTPILYLMWSEFAVDIHCWNLVDFPTLLPRYPYVPQPILSWSSKLSLITITCIHSADGVHCKSHMCFGTNTTSKLLSNPDPWSRAFHRISYPSYLLCRRACRLLLYHGVVSNQLCLIVIPQY